MGETAWAKLLSGCKEKGTGEMFWRMVVAPWTETVAEMT